jgi:hypothetical protein
MILKDKPPKMLEKSQDLMSKELLMNPLLLLSLMVLTKTTEN